MDTANKALAEQRRLLQMEYETEKRAYTESTERMGFHRLVARGDAWADVQVGNTAYNSLNQRTLEVSRDEKNEDDHHFEHGRPVAFVSFSEDSRPIILFTGSVSYVDGNRLVAVIPDSAPVEKLIASPGKGIMLSFDETTYRAMFEALDRTARAKGRLGQLRDLFYSRRPAERFTFPSVGFAYLNPSQQEGVNSVLRAKDVAIVHGPPGTGKTTTLVEAIHETLRRESQVLVCAQSNMAVDWISEKLSDRGIHVLRIGNPARVNDKMLASTYERRFEDHPDYPSLWSIRRDIRLLQSLRKRGDRQWHQKLDRLRARATELEFRINNDLFNAARVIACTLTGSASRVLSGMKFSTLFIDEAAQALEAASWIPIRRAGRVIFAGDHCQLPPTVKSYEAMRGGLGRSLMERIAVNHPETVTLLTEQYRMHEDIMRFPSEWFYNGKMTASPTVAGRGLLDYDIPIVWVPTNSLPENWCHIEEEREKDSSGRIDFHESVTENSYGRINKAEAQIAVDTLKNYIDRIGKQRFLDERLDVGLISPYRAQVQFLRSLIKKDPFFKPYHKLITINTVDGFQGQERDIIVLSLVRSNNEGDIGFLRELRRTNVAMTRARMKLIIIGDPETLCRHPFYRKLYGYVRSLHDCHTDTSSSGGEAGD